jgi:hypothetical protein
MIVTSDDLELELYGSFVPSASSSSNATRQDLYSIFLSRATSMRWSEAVSKNPSVGSLWGMANAVVASSESEPEGLIGWFHVIPLAGPGLPLPIQPLIQCAVDSMRRLGAVRFDGLRLGLPLGWHHGRDGLLADATNWFLASADSRCVDVIADIAFGGSRLPATPGTGLAAEIASRHIEPFIVAEPPAAELCKPGSTGSGEQVSNEVIHVVAPEWSSEAAAWIATAIADAAVRRGHSDHAVIRVAPRSPGGEPGLTQGRFRVDPAAM